MTQVSEGVGRTQVDRAIQELGPWFHNLHLPDGTQTAPDHPLGDFPARKWKVIAPLIPENLYGWSVLDVGCNAGFYSLELARRGAHVVGIDLDAQYLRQARWAAEQFGLAGRIEYHQMQIYQLAHVPQQFDLVWFMGVLYHLRYPLLGLDIIAHRARNLMVFQTMAMPGLDVEEAPEDLSLDDRQTFLRPGWPKMAFIENCLAGDPTNWWAANHACVEAMLRCSGFRVMERPAHEIYLCQKVENDRLDLEALRETEYQAAIQQPAITGQAVGNFGPLPGHS
jgi:tRNA (mo5U34)-methyltransferase